jgi:hypothetical protein
MQFLTSRFASIGFSVDGGAPINLGKKNPDSCEPGAKFAAPFAVATASRF